MFAIYFFIQIYHSKLITRPRSYVTYRLILWRVLTLPVQQGWRLKMWYDDTDNEISWKQWSIYWMKFRAVLRSKCLICHEIPRVIPPRESRSLQDLGWWWLWWGWMKRGSQKIKIIPHRFISSQIIIKYHATAYKVMN